jgi:hypothetical protein
MHIETSLNTAFTLVRAPLRFPIDKQKRYETTLMNETRDVRIGRRPCGRA